MEDNLVGKVAKGVKCSISGCSKDALRSLPVDKVNASGLKVASSSCRRAYLCKDHYKEYKKSTKKERKLEQWRFKT